MGQVVAQFTARFAYAAKNDGVLMAGLSDDQYEAVNYLLIQKAIDPSAQDVEQGHDQVHITLNGGTASCYGGIKSISLLSGELKVRVDSTTAETLGTGQDFSVSFDHHLKGLDELSLLLEKMFDSFVDGRG